MKRIVIAVLSTISGLVLLFSYPTSTNRSVTADTAPAAGTGTTTGAAAAGTAAAAAPSAAAAAPAAAAKSGTFTGSTVQTRWGPVQVQIVVANGKVTSADAIQYPSGNGNDQRINSYAIPILNAEAVKASSAKIDMVSGATVTSTGYLKSLQNAIDQAFPA
ncbi:MAG TPA: FMN-binding protein [Cellulomonas sp.]|uniref:FMN-binding protein n=1 Tax=Cellulomonas sp. TaxID=40001 RepID=UPI002E37E261|nr:FMN-binding protein [Cellulomonas sp.]HEX5332884.1 FMN-binding protein [Cellulomonas sp.]